MSIKLLNLELFELKFAHERYKTYVLFDGWEVRMVKNCDRGLENAARGPLAAFLSPKSQFFTIRTDPKPANNMFIFFPAVNWFYRLQMGLFTQLLSLNRLARRLRFVKNLGNERVTQIVDKERCIKEQIFFRITLC